MTQPKLSTSASGLVREPDNSDGEEVLNPARRHGMLYELSKKLVMTLPRRQQLFLLRHLGRLARLPLQGRKPPSIDKPDSAGEGGLSTVVRATFHVSAPAALEAYSFFNQYNGQADSELDADMIARAVEFGYLHWPRKIRDHVYDKDILDVGCGTGNHSIGYVVVGAKSYTGIDPVVSFDNDRSKNLRSGKWERFGWTPRQVMDQFDRVRIVSGSIESFSGEPLFDVAVLHNVTEHLFNIENVVRDVAARLREGGVIIFNHHNFYSWNGHHTAPKKVAEIDPDDPKQQQVLDWSHVRFDAPPEHYISRGLNRIRIDDLKILATRYFELSVWDEIPSDKSVGGGRLTDEITTQFPELTRRDLEVHNVLCIARRKAQPNRSPISSSSLSTGPEILRV